MRIAHSLALVLMLFATVGGPARADGPPAIVVQTESAGARTSQAANSLRALARAEGTVNVIVTLKVQIDPDDSVSAETARRQRAALRRAQDSLRLRVHRDRRPIRDIDRFEALPMLAMRVTEVELERLLADPAVASVHLNRTLRIVPRLDEMRAITRVQSVWRPDRANYGIGATIAIVDDQLSRDIPQIRGRVAFEACVSDMSGCYDAKQGTYSLAQAIGPYAALGWRCRPPPAPTCLGHGGAVALVAAGEKQGKGTHNGFGPGFDIVAVRIDDRQPPPESVFAKALEIVYQNRRRFDIKVLSMSMQIVGYRSRNVCDGVLPAIDALSALLHKADVVFTNSAGNDASLQEVDYPGCKSDVLSIGASTETEEQVADFSDSGSLVDLVSPADAVQIVDGRYESHGTSFAAPSAAAAIALLRAAFPDKSGGEVVTALKCTGKQLNRLGTDKYFPRIDVAAAYNFLAADRPKLAFEFEAKGDSAGWYDPFKAGTVEGGGYTFHHDSPNALVFNDLCFNDFDLDVRGRHAFPSTSGAYHAFGVLLLQQAKRLEKAFSNRLYHGYAIAFRKHDIPEDKAYALVSRFRNRCFVVPCRVPPTIEFVGEGRAPGTPNGFNTLKIRKSGERIQVYINGELTVSFMTRGEKFLSFALFPATEPAASHQLTVFDYVRFQAR
jgi:subtilisin family serine protease